eukprot:SM000357S13389  [mRNA]  locus=s357:31333:31537:+ [translate_table: standard]
MSSPPPALRLQQVLAPTTPQLAVRTAPRRLLPSPCPESPLAGQARTARLAAPRTPSAAHGSRRPPM